MQMERSVKNAIKFGNGIVSARVYARAKHGQSPKYGGWSNSVSMETIP